MTVNSKASDTAFDAERFASNFPNGIQNHYWIMGRSKIVLRLLRPLVQCHSDVIIDIGCGRGINVSQLRKHGFNAFGCDIGTPRPIAPEINEFLFLGKDALDLDHKLRQAAKHLILLDVLEHIEGPEEFLSRCYERFTSCEYVIVTVPARQELWSNYDDHYGHFRRYETSTIHELVPKERFQLLRCGYFCHALYVPLRLMALFGINRNVRVRPPRAAGIRLHQLLSRFLEWEERIVPSSIPGSSLYCILQRK